MLSVGSGTTPRCMGKSVSLGTNIALGTPRERSVVQGNTGGTSCRPRQWRGERCLSTTNAMTPAGVAVTIEGTFQTDDPLRFLAQRRCEDTWTSGTLSVRPGATDFRLLEMVTDANLAEQLLRW